MMGQERQGSAAPPNAVRSSQATVQQSSKGYDILFEPVAIGPVTARNRFFQVPHCTGMGNVNPHMSAAMREVKAEGGWAVVCTEYCSIHPTSLSTPRICATLWDEDDIRAHALMTERVHRHGALAGVELWHGGDTQANHTSREVSLGVASLPAGTEPVQCRAMDKQDIRNLRRWHVDAARRAQRAGFDVIYVYATHRNLLAQFLSSDKNRRTDEYGGSVENRTRLVRELIEETKDAVGDTCAVALRCSVDEGGHGDGVVVNDDQRAVIELLADLPDLWDVTVADYSLEMGASRFVSEAALEDYVAIVKRLTSKPVVGVGRFTSPDAMVGQIRRGVLDFIGAARPSIADPFLPRKILEGRSDDIRECIGCNICYASDALSAPLRCTQNPTMGDEWRRGWHPEVIPPKGSSDHILVVGAGPAGLEAARSLGNRGYEVTLAEAGTELGGRVNAEARLPGLAAWDRVRDYRERQIAVMTNVEVFRASRLGSDDVLEVGADRIVLATGARWRNDGVGRWHRVPVPLSDDAVVLTPDDIMAGAEVRGPVVIYDDDHYYMGGLLAEELRRTGHQVSLVTPAGYVSAWGIRTHEQQRTQTRLLELGVTIFTGHILAGTGGGAAEIACAYTGRRHEVAAASVVSVTARLPNDTLYNELVAHGGATDITRIGDCLAPGTIAHAVYAGHRFAREIDDGAVDKTRRRELPRLAE
jgi:dimethylamine/trimethylamine dehydrogenase